MPQKHQVKRHKSTKQNTAKAPNDLQNRQEGGFISSYHDRYDLEADAVLDLDDGRYALIEFKLGSREIEEAKYKSKEITPKQEALLGRPNSDQYPAERELSTNKVTESSPSPQTNATLKNQKTCTRAQHD